MHSLVHEWPRADNDVIFDMVIHFIAIFNVDACASHVPEDIVADSREMSPMDDDTSLVRLLDSVISELTVRAKSGACENEGNTFPDIRIRRRRRVFKICMRDDIQ